MILATGILTVVGAGALLLADAKEAADEVTRIERNAYGEGWFTKELEIEVEGTDLGEKTEITVGEQQYTQTEMQEVFRRSVQKLERIILAENESMDEVCEDLNLVTSIPGEPVGVEWELDRYDVMNVYGELNRENLKSEKDGVLIHLKAYLSYTEDEKQEAVHEMTVRACPAKRTKTEALLDTVEAKIMKVETKTRTEESFELPDAVSGKRVIYRTSMNSRGAVLMVAGLIVCVLLWCLDKQNERDEEKKRQEQMMRDYPGIVNKLVLLIGAGMTVKKAWRKIAEDYEKQKDKLGIRYAYEEMEATCHEMRSGVTEAECYERFGRRCGVRAYRKLGALLSQNLRKGTKGITGLLHLEAIQAFEERKAQARQQGEEAGTRLLMPMFGMLAVVLVIVIVPAFLSIRI